MIVLGQWDVLPIFLFLLGACWGSFANVVILRLPQGLSVVRPRSHCPQCQKAIRWFHNIPLFSWFILRGKCADCGASISFRYPLIEMLMAVLFVMVYYATGFNWLLLEYLIFVFGLVVVSFIDFDHMILPDLFTLSGIVLGLLGSFLNPERDFASALIGVLVGGGISLADSILLLAFAQRRGDGRW